MILSIISVVITIGLYLFLGYAAGYENKVFHKFHKYQAICLVGLIPLIFGIITFVPANNVGIKYSPFSGVSELTLREGLHVKNPLEKIYKISTEVQSQQLVDVSGQTKDAQFLTIIIDVKYRVDNDKAFEVFRQFRTIDNLSENLIGPLVQRCVETVTTQYNVIDILGEKRNEVYSKIETELGMGFTQSGVSFYSVTFTDTDAGPEIENAIKAEAVAKKAVETAEQERQKALVESETLKVKAQGAADAKIIESESLAEQLRIEAQGKLDSYNLKNEALNENILYIEYLNKWDGKLPKVMTDDETMLSIPALTE